MQFETVLDMASPAWEELDIAEQIARAREAQAAVATSFGIKTERNIEINGAAFEFMLIPPGRYMMGARTQETHANPMEFPRHPVSIDRPFWLGKHPVTQRQWKAITGEKPWESEQYSLDDDQCPAVNVSWLDVKEKLLPKLGPRFFLPREAEWEYACRAGSTSRFYWGEDPDYTEIDKYAWYDKNCWRAEERYAHPVAQKLPNAWSLYDMSGNVLEWCDDIYRAYAPRRCSVQSSSGSRPTYVVRGGYWSFWAQRCRSAYRCSCAPELRDCLIGLRLGVDSNW
jgi:formylglycine-generating enzyme required for sulfatase activity